MPLLRVVSLLIPAGWQVAVPRTGGSLTVGRVDSVRPGRVRVTLDSSGRYKDVDEKELCRLITQL